MIYPTNKRTCVQTRTWLANVLPKHIRQKDNYTTGKISLLSSICKARFLHEMVTQNALRSCQGNRSYHENKLKFETAVHLTNDFKQIKLSIPLYTCTPMSEVPFNLLGDPQVNENIYCKSRNLPNAVTQNYSTDLR